MAIQLFPRQNPLRRGPLHGGLYHPVVGHHHPVVGHHHPVVGHQVVGCQVVGHQVIALLVGLAIGFSLATARAEQTAACLAKLPAKPLVMLHVRQLDQLAQQAAQFGPKFGLQLPDFSPLLAALPGMDPAGEMVIGLADLGQPSPSPFVLLPVSDYDHFVESLAGDRSLAVTPISLAGEELLAAPRGNWALLTNRPSTNATEPQDLPEQSPLSKSNQLAAQEVARLQQLLGKEELTLLVTQGGLAQLSTWAQLEEANEQQVARQRRYLGISPFHWQSGAFWKQVCQAYRPTYRILQREVQAVAVGASSDPTGNLTLRGRVLPRVTSALATVPENSAPTSSRLTRAQPTSVAAIPLPGPPAYLAGHGPWGSAWSAKTLDLYLSLLVSRSDQWGVHRVAEEEFRAYCDSVQQLAGQVSGASLALLAPPLGQPVQANQVLLLEVSHADEALAQLGTVVTDWNRLIENSSRDADLVFDAQPVTIAHCAGIRYSVDLPTAFRSENIPEVRQVLEALYGHQGQMVFDCVVVDDHHLLVSGLPETLTQQVLHQWRTATRATQENHPPEETATEQPVTGWHVTLHPAELQKWLNRCQEVSVGEEIIGWKPKTFSSHEAITLKITPEAALLRVQVDIPSEVIDSLGERFFSHPSGRR